MTWTHRLRERVSRRLEERAADLSRAAWPPPFMGAMAEAEEFLATDLLGRNAAQLARAKAISGAEGREVRAALAVRFIRELRARMEEIPRDRPLLSLVARLDAALPTDAGELMDDPRLDWKTRKRILKVLDDMTRRSGDYLVLGDLVRDLFRHQHEEPGALLDLASGSGGFLNAFARRKDRPPHLHLIATDIERAYLEIGRRQADAAHVGGLISFRQLDAFDLEQELDGWKPDVITCLRSLHHFGVAGTVRLLEQAIKCADRHVLFVDIARSISRMMMAAGAGLASGSWRFAHDAVLSVRKAFSVEELRLIAACASGAEEAEVHFTSPAYAVLRVRVRERG
jgi:2-polyprenyl-3-methyl-5-hydroxy-6-metoxy-1,4-benzoquinol methylase